MAIVQPTLFPHVTEAGFADRICAHLDPPGQHKDFLFVRHFRPTMGSAGDYRFIDLWGVRMSKAENFRTVGIEIKISRSDWLHELKQPAKRRMMEAVSNQVYLVALKGICKLEELPPRWGLMEILPTAEIWSEQVEHTHPAEWQDKVRPTWGLVASAMAAVESGRAKAKGGK